MDANKINGLLEAIESEIKTPAPSHQNLGRLVLAALREIVGNGRPQIVVKPEAKASPSDAPSKELDSPSDAPSEPEEKPKKKTKRKSK